MLLFSEAKDQGMMTDGYVWIISDLTIGTLSLDTIDADILSTIQGIIGIRGYYATESPQLQAFISEWNNRSSFEKGADEILIYALYAYDATRMLALAIDSYIKDGYNITFKNSTLLSLGEERSSDLSQLKVFDGGPLLINYIAYTQFNGTSGYIELNANGDLIRSAFEIVNVVDGKYNKVGYWSNETQLSVTPPGNVSDANVVSAESLNSGATALNILWPGNLSDPPRGWLLPKNGRPLQIAVPRKIGFKQFLSWNPADSSNSSMFTGYCIDVFNEALKYLPYTVPYDFKLFGNETGLVYNDMIYALAAKV
jgi:ionotropic glutamate receptor